MEGGAEKPKHELTSAKPMRLLALTSLFLPMASAHALEIRNYSSSRHDRFVTDENGTQPNPGAYYVSSRYSGLGYATDVNDPRQYTLVTPQHVLFAKHFAPSTGTNIRFLNATGEEFTRTTISTADVPNGLGGVADVIIVKLDAPLPADQGITPFPYLNLASESLYSNTVLATFGHSHRAGRGLISLFSDFMEDGIDSTRTFTFIYDTDAGDQDDAYLVGGDSGSPSFALVNNRPALVGLHLAADITATTRINIDTFVPHYVDAINTLLAPEGYQLIPAYPDPVSLSAEIATGQIRQAEPSTLQITVTNSSANTATNPRLNLVFPTEAIPSSVTAPGWIIQNPSPGNYRLHSAAIGGNSSASATITYNSVPSIQEIPIQATHLSDGSPSISETFELAVEETFAGFVSALSLKGKLDDPDLDGIGNLIEYAFGGNPSTNSNLATGGYPLAPQISVENGLNYTYPRRTDATQRGLTYETEFSGNLESASWDTTLPAGAAVSTASFDPDVPGFEQVTITIPAASPENMFVRVKVTLSE
jgi:hypothetical protein